MRLTGQVLAVFAAMSALYMLFSVWANLPVGFVIAAFLLAVSGVPALVIAYVLDHRPRAPVHGPVLKWGVSEDAIHEGYKQLANCPEYEEIERRRRATRNSRCAKCDEEKETR